MPTVSQGYPPQWLDAPWYMAQQIEYVLAEALFGSGSLSDEIKSVVLGSPEADPNPRDTKANMPSLYITCAGWKQPEDESDGNVLDCTVAMRLLASSDGGPEAAARLIREYAAMIAQTLGYMWRSDRNTSVSLVGPTLWPTGVHVDDGNGGGTGGGGGGLPPPPFAAQRNTYQQFRNFVNGGMWSFKYLGTDTAASMAVGRMEFAFRHVARDVLFGE